MITTLPPIDAGLLDQSVPRYASYPTAAQFHDGIGAAESDRWLADLRRGADVGLYLHIPFCRKVCWFCVCRTQGVAGDAPLRRFIAALRAEISRTAERLPAGVRVSEIHWGGGSPTILAPGDIRALDNHLRSCLPMARDARVTVEIDPRNAPPDRLDALAEAGMTDAWLGVQDFDPAVQRAIGRLQDQATTASCAGALRARGLSMLGIDMVYGLPGQSVGSLRRTAEAVLALEPDRISVVGYAHLPWMAKRQRMICEAMLPDAAERLRQFSLAGRFFRRAGYATCGIDHFARAGDKLASAAQVGHLRRGFHGYSAAAPDALIGFGASAISRFPQGFVQNALQTATYEARVEAGWGAGQRGVALCLEDRVRARAIEMIMCNFSLDLAALRAEFGDFVGVLDSGVLAGLERFRRHVRLEGDRFEIVQEGPLLARLVARLFDSYATNGERHSLAI